MERAREAAREDRLVAVHYAGVALDSLRPARTGRETQAYVSYRINGRIYWTRFRHRIPANELVLTDGANNVRARCGNRLSDTPRSPIRDGEPTEAMMEPMGPQYMILPAAIQPGLADDVYSPWRGTSLPVLMVTHSTAGLAPFGRGPVFGTTKGDPGGAGFAAQGIAGGGMKDQPIIAWPPDAYPPVPASAKSRYVTEIPASLIVSGGSVTGVKGSKGSGGLPSPYPVYQPQDPFALSPFALGGTAWGTGGSPYPAGVVPSGLVALPGERPTARKSPENPALPPLPPAVARDVSPPPPEGIPNLAVTPEPAALVLTFGGLVLLALWARRRSRGSKHANRRGD